jgi:hypothetical protein
VCGHFGCNPAGRLGMGGVRQHCLQCFRHGARIRRPDQPSPGLPSQSSCSACISSGRRAQGAR